MASLLPTALKVGALALPFLMGRKNKAQTFDPGAINAKWMNWRPEAYTTDADVAASERGMARTGEIAGARFTAARAAAQNRMRARGLGMSPAAEYGQNEITRAEGDAALGIGRQGADQLYRAGQSNLGFERQKGMTAWGAELGAAAKNFAGEQARQASFWNSMLPFVGNAVSWFGGSGSDKAEMVDSTPGAHDSFMWYGPIDPSNYGPPPPGGGYR